MLVDGPHFQATNEGELVFLLSDGDSSRRPTEHDILEPEEESGTLRHNYYLRIPLDHPDSQRWRAEIAKYLAPLVLGTTMGHLPWTLADFPQDYVLLLHISPRRARPSSKPRRDFYLYGATDVPSFASPLEFVKHAEWLMRGAHRTLDARRSPRCACKYCDVDSAQGAQQKQSAISRKLRSVRGRVLAQINGDELEEDDVVPGADAHAGANGDAADADGEAEAEAVTAEATTVDPPATENGGDAEGD